jgi:hypothetical protein
MPSVRSSLVSGAGLVVQPHADAGLLPRMACRDDFAGHRLQNLSRFLNWLSLFLYQ